MTPPKHVLQSLAQLDFITMELNVFFVLLAVLNVYQVLNVPLVKITQFGMEVLVLSLFVKLELIYLEQLVYLVLLTVMNVMLVTNAQYVLLEKFGTEIVLVYILNVQLELIEMEKLVQLV